MTNEDRLTVSKEITFSYYFAYQKYKYPSIGNNKEFARDDPAVQQREIFHSNLRPLLALAPKIPHFSCKQQI